MSTQNGGRTAFWVISGIIFLGVIMGLGFTARFVYTEEFLHASVPVFEEKGKTLSAVECREETIEWAKTCDGVNDLCRGSVDKMMVTCLQGKDRTEECKAENFPYLVNNYGYKDCTSRNYPKVGHKRPLKEVCGRAYTSFYKFCKRVVGKDELNIAEFKEK